MTTASPSPIGSGSGSSGSGSVLSTSGGATPPHVPSGGSGVGGVGVVTAFSSASTRASRSAIASVFISTCCSSAATRCSSCGSSVGLGIGVPVGGNPPAVACYPQGEPPAMSMMSMPHTHEVRYRELSYAQKRAIREQLEASFDWDDGKYAEGASDHSIAAEVGIPWSLIRYVRERDFGQLA